MTKYYLYDVHETLKQRPVFAYEITAAPVEHWTLISKHDTEKDAVDALRALRPVADIDDSFTVSDFRCACAMVVEYDVDQDGAITEDLGTVATSEMPPLPVYFDADGESNFLSNPFASAVIKASCLIPDDCTQEDYGYFALRSALLNAISKSDRADVRALKLSFPYDNAKESFFSDDAHADARVTVDLFFDD